MAYKPPFEQTTEISNLCLEIAELVGMLHPNSELSTSPTLHRKLRIRTIHSSLMIEGNTLSEEAVTAIMDGERVLGPAKDILEVENAQHSYALAPMLAQSNRDASSEVFGLFMLEIIHDALLPFAYPDGKANIRGQQALSFFAENPTETVSELAEVLGCSKRSAERIVARPRKDCLPEREDGTRGGRWIV